MSISKVVGILVALMGFLAGLGNYLWLIGFVPEPNGDLMAARWTYQAISWGVAALLIAEPWKSS